VCWRKKKLRRCLSPVKRLPRVRDKIIGVTLGGFRVTGRELAMIQLAWAEGYEAGKNHKP
jgi:hypothetical protein